MTMTSRSCRRPRRREAQIGPKRLVFEILRSHAEMLVELMQETPRLDKLRVRYETDRDIAIGEMHYYYAGCEHGPLASFSAACELCGTDSQAIRDLAMRHVVAIRERYQITYEDLTRESYTPPRYHYHQTHLSLLTEGTHAQH